MTGLQQGQTRLELVLEDRPGAFLAICRLIQEQGGEIVSVVSSTARHQGVEKPVMIFRLDGVRPDPLVTSLEPAGHTLLSITT